ncbi:MAG TPA: LssY C-terminal domain-containing protein [Terriglobia bacterium]|nr:LssY C-terminal domain-containing protein [Terriglobia bacterium]
MSNPGRGFRVLERSPLVVSRRRRGLTFTALLLAAALAVPSSGYIAAQSTASAPFTLPAETVIWLRLETPISTKSSHLHDPATAVVEREVKGQNGVAIPLGAKVTGRIEKLIPSSSPDDRARLLVRFTQVQIPGQSPIALAGHISEVENARETVLADGTIQGLLLSEIPVSRLEGVLGKLSKSNPGIGGEIEKASQKNLGESDTSIVFPAGADLAWVLDKPLAVERTFPPAVTDQLDSGASVAVEQLLADAPHRAQSKDGKPGDPLNLVVIGSAEQIRSAFVSAGWSAAEEKNQKSIMRTVRAIAGDEGYGSAPVSQLYVYGRQEDLAFERMLNTFTKRHHLRLWRTTKTTPDGREIWLGAATHDTGIDVHPGVVSHAIDSDLDAERTKVGADLEFTGMVSAQHLVTRADPLSQGLTATGGTWKTDGRLLTVELKSGAAAASDSARAQQR